MIQKSYEDLLIEFHLKQGQPIDQVPDVHPDEKLLRLRLMASELGEVAGAIGLHDRVEIADGLADLVYVAIGTAVTYGIPFDQVFREVHRSNMTKGTPAERAAGMKGGVKGPNFEPPRIREILGRGPRPQRTTPKIVCLCGSTRFTDAFQKAQIDETLEGNIVLSVGCFVHSDEELQITGAVKEKLDELHKRKIDLADEIFVLNVGGYIGESTRSEIDYAMNLGKPVLYLEPLSL